MFSSFRKGKDMKDRRKSKRTEMKSKIIINRLDENDGTEIGIDVFDLSKTGIGFRCNHKLDIGGVYESYLTIWTKEVLHAFLEIRRIEKEDDDRYVYGAIFIGMPEMDLARISVYQTVEEQLSEK